MRPDVVPMMPDTVIDALPAVLPRASNAELVRLVEIARQEITRRDPCAGSYLDRCVNALRGLRNSARDCISDGDCSATQAMREVID